MSTMTNAEIELLHSYMDKSKHYLEFGSGESTIYAAGVSTIKSIDSVESSSAYVNENLRPNDTVATALASGRLRFHLIDIGITQHWGYPSGREKEHLFPNYSLSVFTEQSNHDLAFIDGRFRVACTLSCILNTPADCIIMIHDFWNRNKYHVVLDYLDTIARADTLGVFKKKPHTDTNKIQSLLSTYQYLISDKSASYRIKRELKRVLSRKRDQR